jgi:hypothetical protein
VLKAQATSRGIELDESVLDWLFARYARDLGALLELLDKLDRGIAGGAAQNYSAVLAWFFTRGWGLGIVTENTCRSGEQSSRIGAVLLI